MQSWFDVGAGAFQLLIVMTIAWIAVFLVSRITERRLRRKSPRRASGGSGVLGWLWDYSNPIGIGSLFAGAAYLIWAMNWGGGLGTGPTALVILLMMAGGFMIGFAPASPGKRH